MAATPEERLGVLEAGLAEVRRDIHDIKTDTRELRDTLAGRPSWMVATVITLLFGTCTTLAALLAAAYGG